MQLPVHTERNIDVSLSRWTLRVSNLLPLQQVEQKVLIFSGETTSWTSSSVFSWGKENQESKLSKWMWKKDIFLFSFYLCLHFSFEDVSSTVIAVKAVTGNTLQCRRKMGKLTSSFFFNRCSFQVLICFVFSFYSETKWSNAPKIFRIGPLVALKKSIFDFKQKYEHYYMKKKQTLRVNSSMNLITAVCAQIEWEEHSWPVDQTEATFLVELVSYCHSIHLLTRNKIKNLHKKIKTQRKSINGHFHNAGLEKSLWCQFLVEQDFKMGSKQRASKLPPRAPHFSVHQQAK